MNERQQLMEMVVGHVPARALQVAAMLGLADQVLDGTDTAEGLAAAAGIDRWRMQRFMRVLIALGIFTRSGKTYHLTERGRYLAASDPDNIAAWTRMQGYFYLAYQELQAVLKTGQPGYEIATGRRHFDAMADMPDFATSFDLGMNQMMVPETLAMIEKFDFGRFSHLMDVGGGNGYVLIHALESNPQLEGVLFDLPDVVERAGMRIAESPANDRCTAIGGSFFEPLPKALDAILLRHIIHDWTEEEALVILGHCRDALPSGGTLLIAEALIEDSDHLTVPIRLDLSMMTFYNGAERTLEEYRDLLEKAGLRIEHVTEISPALAIMEARVA